MVKTKLANFLAEGMEEDICAKGLVKSIVLAMTKDAKVTRSQSLGARIVSSLCANPNVRAFLGV